MNTFFELLAYVLATIGILTIVKLVLYFNLGNDYESITVKYFNNDTYKEDLIMQGYNVIQEFDLSKDFPGDIKKC